MNKSRVEAITDGIIAIAATIMVLELGIPAASNWTGLLEIRHTFLAYVISFFMIYIVWSMRHDLFRKAERISRRTFMVNGVWIFVLTLVPFTTVKPELSIYVIGISTVVLFIGTFAGGKRDQKRE